MSSNSIVRPAESGPVVDILDVVVEHAPPAAAAPAPKRGRSFWPRNGLWRHPGFLKLWAADSISQLGTQLTALALPLIAALSLNAGAGQMGLLVAAETAPALLAGLVVGVWVDRIRRKPVMVAADLGRAALLAAIPILWALDALRMEALYAVGFGVGLLTVFFDIAYLAFLPTLVRRDELQEGNGKLEASASFAQVAGPGLGGGLIGLITAPGAVVFDVVSFVASAVFIGRIDVDEPPPSPAAKERGFLASIGEGLRAVAVDPILRGLVLCSATITFFGWAFLAVYVLYMTEDLGLGATEIGFVFASGGAGALIGAVLSGPAAKRFGVGPTIVVSRLLMGIFGLTVPIAVLAPTVALPMVVFAEFAQWLAMIVANVNTISLRQAVTPDRLQGRVNATWRFIVGGVVPIGGLMGGLIGEWFGVQTTLVIGIVGMLASVIWVWFSPLRHLREIPHLEPELAGEATGSA